MGILQLQTIELEKPPKPIPTNMKIIAIKVKTNGINMVSFLNSECLNFKFSAFKSDCNISLYAPF